MRGSSSRSMPSSGHSSAESLGQLPSSVLDAAVRGGGAAQERLLNAAYDYIRHMLTHTLGAGGELQDLQQAVLTRLIRGLPKFIPGSSVSIWIGGLCIDVVREHVRNRQVRRKEQVIADPSATSVRGSDGDEALLQAAPLPRLEQHFAELPREQRLALGLRASGLDVEEISTIMSSGVDSTRSRLSRGRRGLAAFRIRSSGQKEARPPAGRTGAPCEAADAGAQADLIALLMGDLQAGDEKRVKGHAQDCRICTAELRSLRADFSLRAAAQSPPTDEPQRRRQVKRALDTAVRPSLHQRWKSMVLVLSGSILTAAAALWLMTPFEVQRVDVAVATIDQGTVEILQSGGGWAEVLAEVPLPARLRVVGGRPLLELGEGVVLVATPGSEFDIGAGQDPSERLRVKLAAGMLVVQVDSRPPQDTEGYEVLVQTQALIVRTSAARFTIRQPADAKSPSTVIVDAGNVVVRHSAVTATREAGESLIAGEQFSSGERLQAGRKGTRGQLSEASRRRKAREVRARLRRGDVRGARLLLSKVRNTDKTGWPESSLLDAEADLAEGRQGRAIKSYLRLTRKFPKSIQAETALFAAGQLALDHPNGSVSGAELLRRYQRRYPQGRFSGEVEALLGAL